jgi:hypothetical protein
MLVLGGKLCDPTSQRREGGREGRRERGKEQRCVPETMTLSKRPPASPNLTPRSYSTVYVCVCVRVVGKNENVALPPSLSPSLPPFTIHLRKTSLHPSLPPSLPPLQLNSRYRPRRRSIHCRCFSSKDSSRRLRTTEGGRAGGREGGREGRGVRSMSVSRRTTRRAACARLREGRREEGKEGGRVR